MPLNNHFCKAETSTDDRKAAPDAAPKKKEDNIVT